MTIYLWQQQYQKLLLNIYKPVIVYKRIIADHSSKSHHQLHLVPDHSSSFKNWQQQYIWQQERIKAFQEDHSSWALINTYIFAVVPEDHLNWPVPSPTSSGGPQRTHICGLDLAASTANIGNTWLIIELTKRFHNWKWSTTYWNFECMGQLQFSLPFLWLGLAIGKSPTNTWVVIKKIWLPPT